MTIITLHHLISFHVKLNQKKEKVWKNFKEKSKYQQSSFNFQFFDYKFNYFHTHIPIFIFSQSITSKNFSKNLIKLMRVARKNRQKKTTCWSHFKHSTEQVSTEKEKKKENLFLCSLCKVDEVKLIILFISEILLFWWFFSRKIAFSASRPGVANPRPKKKFLRNLVTFRCFQSFAQFFF
jgi:hypothetical protein